MTESLGWCPVNALQWPQSLRLEDRLDFIPSKQTDVIEELREVTGEESCESDEFYKVPRALLKPVSGEEEPGDRVTRTGEEELPGSQQVTSRPSTGAHRHTISSQFLGRTLSAGHKMFVILCWSCPHYYT